MSDTYMDVLDELKELTLKKRAGYSPGADPFANFRMSETFGVKPEVGIMIRVMDKIARIASLMKNPDNDKVGESLRDTLMDAGNYCLIAVAYMDSETKTFDVGAFLDRLFDTSTGDDEKPTFTGFPDGIEEDVFDSSDMEPPEDGDLVFTVEDDGSISEVSGGPLEEPVSTGPLDVEEITCCIPDCDDCEGECTPDKTDCDPNCTGCVAQMYNRSRATGESMFSAKQDNTKSRDHDEASCLVCQVIKGQQPEAASE